MPARSRVLTVALAQFLLKTRLGLAQLTGDNECDHDLVPDSEESMPSNVMLLQTDLKHGSLLKTEVFQDAGRGRGTPEVPTNANQAAVFLFEWSWDDVAQECEQFLGPKGFTAALVSPAAEHITGDAWWTRYQPVSYNLTSRSGNETQFISMIQRCRRVGVGIYVDAVFNQCAGASGVGIEGSTFGGRKFPMFGPEDFHHYANDVTGNCNVSDYSIKDNVQQCDLEGMPDLCTECEHVRIVVAEYLNRLIQLGVAGFRIDAAKHQDPRDLAGLLARVNSSAYRFQEVTTQAGEAVHASMYFDNGPVTEFGYAGSIGPKFLKDGLMRDDFEKFGEGWGLAPSDKAIVFTDNHDTQRTGEAPATYKSGEVYNLMNVFMLAHPYGYPMLMSSYFFDNQDQGPPSTRVHDNQNKTHCGTGEPWVCEHRRTAIANMVAWRRAASGTSISDFKATGNALSFCRGATACIAVNRASSIWSVKLQLSLPHGDYCNVIVSDAPDCPRVRVGEDGSATVDVPAMSAVAIHTNAAAPKNKDEKSGDSANDNTAATDLPDVQDTEPMDEDGG